MTAQSNPTEWGESIPARILRIKLTKFLAGLTSCLVLALVTTANSVAGSSKDDPKGDVSLSLGVFEPRGSGDLWRLNESEFTQSPSDFDGLTGGVRVGSFVNNYLAFDVGGSYYDTTVRSEDRLFITIDGDSVHHHARLRLLPLTIDMRVMPFGRTRPDGNGRAVNRVVPYLGIGGGAMLWSYLEQGSFADPNSLTLFHARYSSRGVTPEYHGVLGAEITLNPEVALFAEGRVSRAKDDLSADFQGFDKFDLSGTSVSIGTRIRF